jgi:hypothetical protein
MFDLIKNSRLDRNLSNLILQSMSLLSKNTEKYFPSLGIFSLNWVRDLFVLSGFKSAELTIAEEDKLKKKNSSANTALFWLSLQQTYPIFTKKAIKAFLPFSTSYLCNAGFSAMNIMKSKNRSQLQTLDKNLGYACQLAVLGQGTA